MPSRWASSPTAGSPAGCATVSFAAAWEQFGENARLHDPERSARAMAAMLRRLEWWTGALRDARGARAYGEAA